jgi:hypothetical protein
MQCILDIMRSRNNLGRFCERVLSDCAYLQSHGKLMRKIFLSIAIRYPFLLLEVFIICPRFTPGWPGR